MFLASDAEGLVQLAPILQHVRDLPLRDGLLMFVALVDVDRQFQIPPDVEGLIGFTLGSQQTSEASMNVRHIQFAAGVLECLQGGVPLLAGLVRKARLVQHIAERRGGFAFLVSARA